MSILNKRCIKYVPNETRFSIDESMVPYYGGHGCKHYIRESLYDLAVNFGMVQHGLVAFVGFSHIKEKNLNAKSEEYGVGVAVGFQFSEALIEAHPGQYHVVFDNFFTSVPLLDKLSSMGHHATGVVRKDRTGKAPLRTRRCSEEERNRLIRFSK